MSNKMELTRTIPARTRTLSAKWCKLDGIKMSKKFRSARKDTYADVNSCHWCKRPHLDGEMMAIASFVRVGNRTLCQKCAAELLSGDDDA